MVEILRWLASNFKSSKRAPKKEPPLVTNVAHQPSSLTPTEIDALIEDRLKSIRDNMRLEMDAYKQGLVDAMSAAAASAANTSNTHGRTSIDTLGLVNSNNASNVDLVGGQPQRAAAAAAVVSSTLATVVALAAATAQCNPLNTPQSAEEKT